MSLLSNPNPIRIGIYSTWSSSWYENNPIYSTLIYTDLYINEFLNGIYYKLKMPTTLPITREIGYNKLLITTKSFISFKKRKSKFRKLFLYIKSMKLKHQKILFFFKRALKKMKLFFFYNKKKIILLDRNKKDNILKKKNKKNYILFINHLKYKIDYKKRKRYKIKKRIIKIISKKMENLKIKRKKKNIYYQLNNRILYKNKRKKQIFFYKQKIKNIIKYKSSHIRRKISRNRLMKYKYFSLNSKIKEKKIQIKLSKKKIIIPNKNIIIFYWLINKINKWFFLLLLKIIIIFKILIGKKISITNNRSILNMNWNYNNKIKNNTITNYIKKIKFILFRMDKINNFIIKSHNPFTGIISKEIKLNKLNLKHTFFQYTRLKSYYRRKKRKLRYNKQKELELRFPPKFHTLNIRLCKTNKKWSRRYYKQLYYNQLRLKIKDTLSTYLYMPILFFPIYQKGTFPRLDNPKLLGDYIKFLMKYEQRNPTILKRIVSIHSKQKKKQRKKSYDFIRKLLKLRKKIIYKLKNNNKWIKTPFIYKAKINRKKIKKKIININNDKKRKKKLYNYIIKNKIKKKMEKNFVNIYKKKIMNKITKNKLNKINVKNNYLELNNLRKIHFNLKFKKIKNKNNKELIIKKNNLKIFKRNKLFFDKINRKRFFDKYGKKNNKEINIIQYKKKTNKLNSLYYNKKNTLKNILLLISIKNKLLKIKKSRIELFNHLNYWKFKFRDLSYKKYPLIGLRIECNGPTKKGRRTQTHLYNEWVDFYTLPGKMPLVTTMNDIQYWQTYGLTRRAAIGIKLWMHFYPAFYSQMKKKLLNKN